jgi:hypothetical protein
MDWIKKHYDQFTLALVSVLLLGFSAFIILKATSFGETFASIQSSPAPNNKIPPVDTTVIQTGQQQLDKPAAWVVNLQNNGPLFVARKYLEGPDGYPMDPIKAGGMALHPPVPNEWLTKYELDLLSGTVLDEDPDKDGFTNRDEYLGADRSPDNGDVDATNPRDAKSFPPYHTKLFVKQYIRVPFRLLFNAYDGSPQSPEKMEFQINTLDLRQPSQFLKIGDNVANTKFKLEKFEAKAETNPSTGEESDVSQLTLVNTETEDRIVLVLAKVTDSPDSFALFSYVWPNPPTDIRVKKNQEFVLKPNVTEKYKLVDIKETEAVIQLPSGEKYTVPRLK